VQKTSVHNGGPIPIRARQSSNAGFTLVSIALSVGVLFGMMGLAFDLGRVYIVRNEAQMFTDSAALGAVSRLNGKLTGVQAATSAVNTNPNRWDFGSRVFSSVATEFSTDQTTWTTAPTTDAGSAGVKYIRVTAPANSVAINFVAALVPSAARSMNVIARSIAGVQVPTSFSQGVFPFAPIAANPADPDFGWTRQASEITLLWPSSVGSNGPVKMNNLCDADKTADALAAVQAGTTADRGYIQETAASAIAAAIEDDHMDYTVTLNQPVSRSGGVKTNDVTDSIAARVAQDSDSSNSYVAYIAGHDSSATRRIVIVPIINNATDAIVIGFAKVFLPSVQRNNPNYSKCALYLGPADLPTGKSNAGDNSIRLMP
jgi:Flp pilus assembly protein TadG